ncbi:MAG: hypothetical protein ACXW31_04570 [Thermoanaerobaculia bacterium]
MEFVLRIFFSGLIAFVPGSDGKELTIAMIDTPHAYEMADGTTLAHHKPLLLARAASCEGDCVTDDHASIAQYLYARKTPEEALTSMNHALLSGGAWQLSGSELSLVGPEDPLEIRTGTRGYNDNGTLHRIPLTTEEREDFSWVADISDLAPGSEGYKTALTASDDPGDLVAARLKLRSGKVITYAVIKIDGKASPVHFRKPSGEGPDAPYGQSLASWVEATIQVPGDSLEIVDQSFSDPNLRRTMRLRPQEGFVEIALLNLPPYETPDTEAPAPLPMPGHHFQIYYDLVKTPPAKSERLIPHLPLEPLASDPQTDWAALHPRLTIWSHLLEDLGLSPRGKGPYEVALCPVTQD